MFQVGSAPCDLDELERVELMFQTREVLASVCSL